MKELTIEEKAKAYDKALERARAFNNGEDVDIEAGTTFCEYIFPELKEGEDERIRKELIDFVKSRLAGFPECDRFIAWLEKQGKEPVWTDNDRIMAFTLLRDVEQMTHISNEGKNERLKWLNTLEDRLCSNRGITRRT